MRGENALSSAMSAENIGALDLLSSDVAAELFGWAEETRCQILARICLMTRTFRGKYNIINLSCLLVV